MKRCTLQQQANQIARANHSNRATEIIFKPDSPGRVIAQARSGYRKNTTDEYVPRAYVINFGWKNTYYQHAVCVVELSTQKLLFKRF